MAGLGTIYVELDLDVSKFEKNQQKLIQSATSTSLSIEKNFQNIGVKSDAIYEAMRRSAENSLEMIKAKSTSTGNEIERAQRAVADKITQINEQQFGKQTSFIDSLKANWVAASAAIVAAWMLVNKAVAYMDEGAKALQVESSFKLMAESAGINSEKLIESMEKATRGTIEGSDLMQKAIKLMLLGYDPSQIERFSNVVITASQFAGTTATDAYERLADAIGNRQPKAMIRMGAVTKEQMEVVNEAIKAGASSTALFELAMANLELKQKMLQGTQFESTIAMQRFHSQVKETGETIGKGLLVGVQALYGGFQWLASGSLNAAYGIAKLVEWSAALAGWTAEKLGFKEKAAGLKLFAESVNKLASDLKGASAEAMTKAMGNISGMAEVEAKATKQQLADSKARVDAQMKELAAFKDTQEAEKKALQEWETFSKAAITAIAKDEDKYWGEFQTHYEIGYSLAKGHKEREVLLNQWAAAESGKILEKIELAELKVAETVLNEKKSDADAEIALILNRVRQKQIEGQSEIQIAAFTSSETTRLAKEDFANRIKIDDDRLKHTKENSQKELMVNMEMVSAREIAGKIGLDREIAEAEAAAGKKILAAKFEYDQGKINLTAYLASITTANLEKDKKIIDAAKKNAEERWKIEKSMSEDIAKFTRDEYDFKTKLLNDEFNTRKTLMGEDQIGLELLLRWKKIKETENYEERALRQGTFWDGMQVAYQQDIRNQTKWGERGLQIWQDLFGPSGVITSTTKTFFVDLFHGQLKTAEDYFNIFKDAVINAIAQMIAQWVAFQAMVAAGNALGFNVGSPGITGNIGGTVANIGVSAGANAGANAIGGGTGGTAGLIGSGLTTAYGYLTGTGGLTAMQIAQAGGQVATAAAAPAVAAGIGETAAAAAGGTFATGTGAGLLAAAAPLALMGAGLAAWGYGMSTIASKAPTLISQQDYSGAFVNATGIPTLFGHAALAEGFIKAGMPTEPYYFGSGTDPSLWMELNEENFKPALDIARSFTPEKLNMITGSFNDQIGFDQAIRSPMFSAISDKISEAILATGETPIHEEPGINLGLPAEYFTAMEREASVVGAAGGIIDELIIGRGQRTGTRYTFGEVPERIMPLKGAGFSESNISELISEVKMLRGDQQKSNKQIIKLTERFQRTIDKWEAIGPPATRV